MNKDILLEIFQLLGGAGLFIFGMKVMTHSLEAVAGNKLRNWLAKLTKTKIKSVLIGTIVSFLIHSGAATVMTVGFIHSGLLNFSQSFGITLGANIGTTLSMQIISFDIGKYCFLLIAIGFLTEMFSKNESVKNLGKLFIGFGILFLGIEVMKEAVAPFKKSEYFLNMFKTTDASTVSGMILGITVSTVFTGIMQSSGAMIGILFALSSSGVINDFKFVFPLILGAHIGTCVVTVIGAIGTNIEAKRASWSHVLFNVIGAVIAALMYPFYNYIIPLISQNNITREIANAHTIIQTVNSVIFLIFYNSFIKFINFIIKSKDQEISGTFLNDDLIITPERAIVSAVKEVERMLGISKKMLKQAIAAFVKMDKIRFIEVEKYEESIDKIKNAIIDYLIEINELRLSSRQTMLTQYVNQIVIEIERIGDHIEKIIEYTKLKIKNRIWFDNDDMNDLIELYKLADQVIEAAILSINIEHSEFKKNCKILTDKISAYENFSVIIRDKHLEKVKIHIEASLTSYFFRQYQMRFDKLVKHIKNVSDIENEKLFYIKTEKLDKVQSKDIRTISNEKYSIDKELLIK
ncbi:Na/Pi cotransporter family protein [Candidatus Dependentiae bacterium]|nr:Na/Pi cotransporter family protein [Candidatus Dependentiae bacterium]